ncbi:hypothetical protein FA15DRAFT_657209 [Coprinopsis marcescibilis]|uniref:Uncharacterized protein n=1 Tax=Coprinopsis marcescibilis TaxID=230819 RepID=A0A5C3KQY3_COPMA|nr:hypothetical protein FA15DRAFT_657209 [Coprinopsis marcescibilis]
MKTNGSGRTDSWSGARPSTESSFFSFAKTFELPSSEKPCSGENNEAESWIKGDPVILAVRDLGNNVLERKFRLEGMNSNAARNQTKSKMRKSDAPLAAARKGGQNSHGQNNVNRTDQHKTRTFWLSGTLRFRRQKLVGKAKASLDIYDMIAVGTPPGRVQASNPNGWVD